RAGSQAPRPMVATNFRVQTSGGRVDRRSGLCRSKGPPLGDPWGVLTRCDRGLAHHPERALDVGGEAGAPGPIVAVGGERLFVAGRQLRGDALLDLVERGAGGRLVADGLDHIVDVAPEGAEPLPGPSRRRGP